MQRSPFIPIKDLVPGKNKNIIGVVASFQQVKRAARQNRGSPTSLPFVVINDRLRLLHHHL
jgi:hypothetical protein